MKGRRGLGGEDEFVVKLPLVFEDKEPDSLDRKVDVLNGVEEVGDDDAAKVLGNEKAGEVVADLEVYLTGTSSGDGAEEETNPLF